MNNWKRPTNDAINAYADTKPASNSDAVNYSAWLSIQSHLSNTEPLGDDWLTAVKKEIRNLKSQPPTRKGMGQLAHLVLMLHHFEGENESSSANTSSKNWLLQHVELELTLAQDYLDVYSSTHKQEYRDMAKDALAHADALFAFARQQRFSSSTLSSLVTRHKQLSGILNGN